MAAPPPPPGFRIVNSTPPPPPPGFRPVDGQLNLPPAESRIGVPRNLAQEDLNARVRGYYGGQVGGADDAMAAYRRAMQAGDTEAGSVIERTFSRLNAEQANPTRNMGTLSRVAAAGGSRLTDYAMGIGQLAGTVTPEQVAEKRRLDSPLMNTTAGFLGGIGTDVALAALPIPGSATVRGLGTTGRVGEAAVRNAALAGLQPVAEGESRPINMGTAATLSVLGDVGGTVVNRALAGTGDDALRKSLQFAADQRIPVTVPQASGNRLVRTIGSAINNVFPFTGGGAAAEAQQTAFNRALSRSFGMDADTISGDVIEQARNRFTQQYNAAFRGSPIQFDTSAVSATNRILEEARDRLSGENFEAVKREVDNLVRNYSQGPLTPQAYQDLRGDIYEAAIKTGGRAELYIRRLRSVLDATARRSLPDQEAVNLLNKTNNEYQNFKIVEGALRRVDGASDNVNPAALWQLINQRGTRATPEMRQFARLGQNVIKNNIPNSASIERGAVVGGLSSLAGGGPLDLATGGKVLGTGALVGQILNNPRLGRIAGLGLSPNTPQFNRFAQLSMPYLTAQGGEAAFSDDYYIPPQEY